MQHTTTSETIQPEEEIFTLLPRSTLGMRLIEQIRSLPLELRNGAGAYLKIALFGNSFANLLPISLARKLWNSSLRFVKHPISVMREALSANKTVAGYIYQPAGHSLEFMADAVAPEAEKPARRGAFKPVLAISGVAHASLLAYMGVIALFGQFLGIRVVNKAYRKLDTSKIVAPLYYTPAIAGNPNGDTLPLDEVLELQRRERERKRAERERAESERAESERKAQEEALAKKQEEEKKNEEPAAPGEFGEINEAPIKDIIKSVVNIYKQGKLGMDDVRFTVMLSFKIARDGSIPQSSIKMVRSSGNQIIDEESAQILWKLGESHALGPLSVLSSNTIQLEVTDEIVRLTITGFAPSLAVAEDLKSKLNLLKFFMETKQKGTDTAELMSRLRITNDNKRLDAHLQVTRAQASEMMNARFGGNNQTQ
jgi:hypothetical protein